MSQTRTAATQRQVPATMRTPAGPARPRRLDPEAARIAAAVAAIEAMPSTPTQPWTELQVLRDLRGVSLRGLARTSGVSLGHLSDLQNGEREPTAKVTARIADALGVLPSMLTKSTTTTTSTSTSTSAATS